MIEVDGGYAESFARSDGLVPGNYRVTIIKVEGPDGGASKPEVASVPKGSTRLLKVEKGKSPFGFARQLIPEQYNAKSTLTAKVEEGGANAFDFPLSSK